MSTADVLNSGLGGAAGQELADISPAGFGTSKRDLGTDTVTPITIDVSLAHELGSWPEDQVLEQHVFVPSAKFPTQGRVKSHVIARGARALTSPAYLACVRRREAKRIANLIRQFPDADDDFVVWTHEPLQRLRHVIRELSEAEEGRNPKHEGNSCEILRQLRDTFLNHGWKRYREPAVRKRAVEILDNLAKADEVSADDAFDAADRLLDLSLDPAVGKLPDDGQEDGEVSG